MFSFITETPSTGRNWRKTRSTYGSMSGYTTTPKQINDNKLNKMTNRASSLKTEKRRNNSELKKTATSMRNKFSQARSPSTKWSKVTLC
jgi:hypothetical protein